MPHSNASAARTALNPRRHDLDALRATAMLLGLAYHAALSFAEGFPWMVQDVSRSRGLYVFQAAVHGFRMPLFFLISGFFTAMMWRKRGLAALLANRFQRILIPCLLGVITIVPAMIWVSGQAIESGIRKQGEIWARAAGSNLWTASASGDGAAVSRFLADGANPNGVHPEWGITPLTLAALRGHASVVALLLDKGAGVNARNGDGGTALHAAAFLGRSDIAELLTARGADVQARNQRGETAVNAAQADWPVTQYIASLFRAPVAREQVEAGRTRIILGLRAMGVGPPADADVAQPARPQPSGAEQLLGPVRWLIDTPVFILVWFLWFLCWFVGVFAIYAAIADRRGWRAPPKWLVLSPLTIIALVLLTILPQWFMRFETVGVGPDTAMGVIPDPVVFFYYALFFGFGILYYDCDDSTGLLGRRWRFTLPISLLVVLPLALEFSTGYFGFRDSVLPRTFHRPASAALQAIYAWLMTFGLMGLFRALLTQESRAIRYVSDSAYWLYLSHLPVIIGVQVAVRDWPMSALLKCFLVTLVVTGVLLALYDTVVRYTWLGTLLNGPRTRPLRRPMPAPASEGPSV